MTKRMKRKKRKKKKTNTEWQHNLVVNQAKRVFQPLPSQVERSRQAGSRLLVYMTLLGTFVSSTPARTT